MADKRTIDSVPVHVMKIGDAYIAGTGGQLFNEFGKRIKAASGAICFLSAFANAYNGYVPLPELILPDVYESNLSKTSALEPAAGDKIVEAFAEIFKKIN